MIVSVAFSPTPTISTTEMVSATETLYGNPILAQEEMSGESASDNFWEGVFG
jgi:hypothetical protein